MLNLKKFKYLEYNDFVITISKDAKMWVVRTPIGETYEIEVKDGVLDWTLGGLHDYIKDEIAKQMLGDKA